MISGFWDLVLLDYKNSNSKREITALEQSWKNWMGGRERLHCKSGPNRSLEKKCLDKGSGIMDGEKLIIQII